MSEKLKRSWLLRYSLRTLLVVVTTFACWLGWEMHYIRKRQAWCREHVGAVATIIAEKRGQGFPEPKSHISWWRSLLGDEAVAELHFVDGYWSKEQCDKALELFPEVEIWSYYKLTEDKINPKQIAFKWYVYIYNEELESFQGEVEKGVISRSN